MITTLAREGYRHVHALKMLALSPLRARRQVNVSYGGARGGDLGGPLVKVRLLSRRFPDTAVGFSLLYQLSNVIRLADWAFPALVKAGVPVVLNQNGVFYPGWYDGDWRRENARMQAVHGSASHVLYQSEFCRQCALKFLGLRDGAWEILHNAVDTAAFTPATERAPGPVRVLLTGKIGASTAYRLIASLEAIAAARRGGFNAELTVAGAIDPDVRAEAEALMAQRHLSGAVRFTGPYSAVQAPEIYRSADLYLMLKHNDPCPNVVIEALASGLPVVHSNSGGVPELVGEAGIGLAVAETFEGYDVPDAVSTAEALAQAFARRETLGTLARERAEGHFSLEHWLARHARLFEELVQA